MLEDLLPFIFMVGGMLAIGITLLVVTVKRQLDTPKEYRSALFGDNDRDRQRSDAESSAGRGGGFQG